MKSQSEVAQSCPILSNPMDCSLPGSSIHGIFQARVLEWGAIAFSDLRASEANYCKLGVWEHEKFLLSPFWRLEVWIRGAGRAVLPLRPWGEMVLASCLLLAMASTPWFAAASHHLHLCCYILLPVSSLHIIFTLCLSSYRDTRWIYWTGAHQNNLILISFAKTLFSNKVTFRYSDLRFQHIFHKDTIQSVTVI